MSLREVIDDLNESAPSLRPRCHGVIEAAEGEFRRVTLRSWPKLVWVPEVVFVGRLFHGYREGDRCLLYYNQPRRFPNFLVAKYIVSARGTSYRTFRRVLEALEEIARIKGSDALLCELATWRISREMMLRWGWAPHCNSRWRRHYIKRFYGNYPPRPAWLG
jgi:hypothetical protein